MSLNAEAILACRETKNFVRTCLIEGDDENIERMDPRPQQDEAADLAEKFRWLMFRKYRQAKMTTWAVMWLLGKVEYKEGIRGVLVAEKTATTHEAFRRMVFAYKHQPAEIQIPTSKAPGMESIEFVHGGGAKCITAGSDAPAIGNSPDVTVLTEYDEYPDQDLFNRHFFPAVNRRPNARVISEGTPGLHGSTGHVMWMKALEGASRFHPVFLKWWLDPTCVLLGEDGRPVPTGGFVPTQEELKLADLMPGITPGHLMFRRQALETEFANTGDQGFRHKYPYYQEDGWLLSDAPAVPVDAIEPYLQASLQNPNPGQAVEWMPWEPGAPYLVTADPAGFGAVGDPSAYTVWHGWDHREVASWSGRVDPNRFADMLIEVQVKFGGPYDFRTRRGCLLAVEANKGETCAALVAKGAQGLYYHDAHTPGWVSTEQRKADAMVALVDMLRTKEFDIRTRETVHQLFAWDGKTRKKGKSAEGKHHYDRAVTCMMAAHLFRTNSFGLRPAEHRVTPSGQVSVADYLKFFKKGPAAGKILGVGR